jgi:RepB DNA-primase from phage plasmid
MVVVRQDRGLAVSLAVLRCQLAAMPCRLYEVRLIHSGSRKPYPGVRQWTAAQLSDPATVGFLRIRNREGYDVYFRPYAGNHNAGYILLDLDDPVPGILTRLRAQGHEPCVAVETSPGRWQAWIRVSPEPLLPALATRVAKRLAQMYAADRASADWRHLGRLAGFTNRKPHRLQADGLPPWVKLIHARDCPARDRTALLEVAAAEAAGYGAHSEPVRTTLPQYAAAASLSTASLDPAALAALYGDALNRLRIQERYPVTDWSIADRWVARELLISGTDPALVAAVLRHGSPGFPRRHADPEDYLRRTLHCAAQFSRAPRRHLID